MNNEPKWIFSDAQLFFCVYDIVYTVGSPGLIASFFSTIENHLENGVRGSFYPILSGQFFQGVIPAAHIQQALDEYKKLDKKMREEPVDGLCLHPKISVGEIIYDNEINTNAENLYDCFIAINGKPFLERLEEAIYEAIDCNASIRILNLSERLALKAQELC